MCFYHDYDWQAAVFEEGCHPAKQATRCDECGAAISPGEVLHTIHAEQYADCHRCEMGECECHASDTCCDCEEPVYGETFDYEACDACSKFLAVVQEVEEDAGCRNDEARPALGRMFNDITDGGMAESKRYFKAVTRRHPELVRSGYLARLYKQMWGYGPPKSNEGGAGP